MAVGEVFSRWMFSEIGRMFGLWHAFKERFVDRRTLVPKSVPLRARINRCFQAYELSADPDVARTARGLLTQLESPFSHSLNIREWNNAQKYPTGGLDEQLSLVWT